MNSLTITIIIIILSTLLAGYLRRNTKDKCIKDFNHDTITLLTGDDKRITGRLLVDSTGLELIYNEYSQNHPAFGSLPDSPSLYSFILYKSEFAKLNLLIRKHANLSEKYREERRKEIERTYHPSRPRRIKRYVLNLFKLLKDSMMEVFTVLTGHLSKVAATKNIAATDINQTGKIQKELVGSIDPAYDPLLEKYIGNIVVVEFDQTIYQTVIKGILKEYTSEYIELLDVILKRSSDDEELISDIVIPRRLAIIRGVGERIYTGSSDIETPGYKAAARKSLSDFLIIRENLSGKTRGKRRP